MRTANADCVLQRSGLCPAGSLEIAGVQEFITNSRAARAQALKTAAGSRMVPRQWDEAVDHLNAAKSRFVIRRRL